MQVEQSVVLDIVMGGVLKPAWQNRAVLKDASFLKTRKLSVSFGTFRRGSVTKRICSLS